MLQRRRFLASLVGFAGLVWHDLLARAEQTSESIHKLSAMEAMRSMSMPAPTKAALAPVDAIPAARLLSPLPLLHNESVEPGQFKATLVASPAQIPFMSGRLTTVWAYNGAFPGPLIELTAGDSVEITLHNHLPQPTTIHWHGLPVPADQDGNPTDTVPPGASRVYRFTLPKDVNGLYWYHPHPHAHTAEQVYRGLAGAIVVRSVDDPLAHLPERILAITDLKLTAAGAIAANDAMDLMNGREGQFVLVNGQRQPRLVFNPAGRERWRIVNATNARYLRLQFPHHPFTLIGTDCGLLERPQPGLAEILVAPAQRVELVVEAPGKPGTHSMPLIAKPYDRGKMGDIAKAQAMPLLQVNFSSAARPTTPLPTTLRTFPNWNGPAAHKRIVMTEAMPAQNGHHKMAFLLNGKTFDTRRIDLVSWAGELEEWEIVNHADMDHPFHLHGTQFRVVARESRGRIQQPPYAALYDTVNLRPKETIRIRVRQPLKGVRVYHCHILEHEDLGMMGQLKVV